MSTEWEWAEELPQLEGSRLFLRSITWEDANGILEVFGDPRVIQYWSSPKLENLSAAGLLIEEIERLFEDRELFQWGICSKDTGEILGTCTLWQLDQGNLRAELGIAIRSRSWGQGYGREALNLLMDFGFEILQLNRLEADVDPNNERSLALFEGLGFRREGYLRERWQIAGQAQDSVLLGLLKRDRTAG